MVGVYGNVTNLSQWPQTFQECNMTLPKDGRSAGSIIMWDRDASFTSPEDMKWKVHVILFSKVLFWLPSGTPLYNDDGFFSKCVDAFSPSFGSHGGNLMSSALEINIPSPFLIHSHNHPDALDCSEIPNFLLPHWLEQTGMQHSWW